LAGTPSSHTDRRIFYGWYIVGASFLLQTYYGLSLAYGFGVILPPVLEETGWSRAETSAIYGFWALEGGLMAPVYGYLIDRWGVRTVVVLGSICGGVGLLIVSRIDTLPLFYFGFAVAGLGIGTMWLGPLTAIAHWFRGRRAFAMALAGCGYAFGALVLPLFEWAVATYGWRASLAGIGVGAFACCIPLALTLRDDPASLGYSVDGVSEPGEKGPEPEASGLTAREAFVTRAFWFLVGAYTLCTLAKTALLPHMIQYLSEVNISSQIGAYAFAAFAVASTPSRLLGGLLGDRYDKRRVLAVALSILSVGMFGVAFITQPWHLCVFVLVVGPGYQMTMPLITSLIGDLFGVRSYAVILGTATLIGGVFWFGAPPFAGWVADTYGSYRPAWIVLGAVTLLGPPLALMIPRRSLDPQSDRV